MCRCTCTPCAAQRLQVHEPARAAVPRTVDGMDLDLMTYMKSHLNLGHRQTQNSDQFLTGSLLGSCAVWASVSLDDKAPDLRYIPACCCSFMAASRTYLLAAVRAGSILVGYTGCFHKSKAHLNPYPNKVLLPSPAALRFHQSIV